jgi:hypothetical protein
MRCPKCQTEVPDGHFYCPNCRVSIYGYLPEGGMLTGGKLERAGRRLLDLLLLLVLIGGGIVLARAIKWKELLNSFNSSAEVSPSIKPEQSSSGRATKRRATATSTQSQEESGNTAKSSSTEVSPDPKSSIEKPPSKSESQPILKPTATPTPPKPDSQ